MSASWIVNVGGRAYGPYTDAQMAAFAAEGRIAPQSLIARSGDDDFRPAASEPVLARLFAAAPIETPASAQRAEAPAQAHFGRNKDDAPKSSERSHIIVIADMKSGSINGLEEEIYKLGQAMQLLPQIWLVKTDQSLNAVRNQLLQQLGKLDKLLVVDATNDKAAWFNFGPEVEARIRRMWSREQDDASKVRATG